MDLTLKAEKNMNKNIPNILLALLEMKSKYFKYSVIFLSCVFSVVFCISFHYTSSLLQSEIIKFEFNFIYMRDTRVISIMFRCY